MSEQYDFSSLPVIGPSSYLEQMDAIEALEHKFPNADAGDFVLACVENTWGPLDGVASLKSLVCVKSGDRDEEDWIWHVVLDDGTIWEAVGWCDYTGWDCQSDLSWTCIQDEIRGEVAS